MVLYRCVNGDRLVGVLPLIVSQRMKAAVAWLQTPMDGHIIAVSPLLPPGEEPEILRALLDAAWTSYPNAVSIEIRDVAETVSPLAWAQGYWHLQIGSRSGRYLRVDGDQDQYQASLSRNFRSNQRKAENKLRRLAGVEVAFVTPDA